MKKLVLFLLLTAILNVHSVFAENEWQSKYDHIVVSENNETYICETYQKDNPSMCYVTDKNGNIIFGPLSGSIRSTNFSNRYIYSDENNNNSVLDENGNVVFGPLPGYITTTDSPDVYTYSEENKYCILDGKGNIYTNLSNKYKNITFIDKIPGHNAYRICINPYQYGIVDMDGNILLPIEYKGIEYCFTNGLMEIYRTFSEDGPYKYGFIDENFQTVIPVEYDGSLICGDIIYTYKNNNSSFDYYKVENNAPVFYKTLDYFIINAREDNTGSNNLIELCKIRTNETDNFGRYGLADKELNILTEPKYDTPIEFYNNYAIIQYGSTEVKYGGKGYDDIYNGKYGVIDKNGNEVIKPIYDNIIYLEHSIDTKDGRFLLAKNGKKEIASLEEEIEYPECSNWAKDCIVYGRWLNIIPDKINSDFSQKITRSEFCELAVRTYLRCMINELDEDMSIKNYCDKFEMDISSNPFNDTENEFIILANKLGIVSGKGNGKFCPDDTITRQEAAVMLVNMADVLDYVIDLDKNPPFSDESYFASWAKDSIYKIVNFKGRADVPVMVGTEENKFSPWYSYSREQAIATMTRIYDIYYWNF